MRNRFRRSPAIAAYAELKPMRYPDKTTKELFFDVLHQLFTEWAIEKEMVDGILAHPMIGIGRADTLTHEGLLDVLGMRPSFAETISAGGATYGFMVQRAAMAIEAGVANAVLCIGAGKFPKVSTGGGDSMAKSTSHEEFEYIYGTFIPAMYALSATRHMYDYGTTEMDLAHVAVSTREWALRNPQAIMHNKGPLSVEKVLASRMIAEPFHMLDCSVPCEGAGVLLVTSGEIARKISNQPAYILGMGEYHTHGYSSQAPNYSSMGAAVSGKKAFEMAGITPRDIQVAEIYDAFTINPLMYVEDLGFVPKGRGGQFFREGRGRPGGDLPVNTYGGLLSFGHCGVTSGISMIVEGVAQVMGKAEQCQVSNVEQVLVHTYGGMMMEHSTLILGKGK